MNALLLIDIQNDFIPGGSLAVKGGDEIIPLVNELQPQFDLVVATQDWHPANHGSFAVNHEAREVGEQVELDGLLQILWPVHCVQGSAGAEFVPALDLSRVEKVFQKGTDAMIDSYSGFFDNGHRKATGLGEYLKAKGVDTVYLAGLALDVCVKFTALDARRLGFETVLIEEATRAVNLQPEDEAKALQEMRSAGVKVVEAATLKQQA
jgi:nicotinamidase/pyrazinamidase